MTCLNVHSEQFEVFPITPLWANKQLNRIFWRERCFSFFVFSLCYSDAFCFWVYSFNATAKKNTIKSSSLDSGGEGFYYCFIFGRIAPPLIYLTFQTDLCRSRPIAFVFRSLSPHDWNNLHRICVLFWQQLDLRAVLHVTDHDVENQLFFSFFCFVFFLVRGRKWERNETLRNIYIYYMNIYNPHREDLGYCIIMQTSVFLFSSSNLFFFFGLFCILVYRGGK